MPQYSEPTVDTSIDKLLSREWETFCKRVFPGGINNEEHARLVEKIFHGGVLVGTLLAALQVKEVHKALDRWAEKTKLKDKL